MKLLLTLLIYCGFTTVSAQEIQSNSSISLKSEKALFVVNDEPRAYDDLRFVKPNDIKSIELLRNQKAIDQFGEGGKNGVIDITLKNTSEANHVLEPKIDSANLRFRIICSPSMTSSNSKYIYVIDGVIVDTESLTYVDPQNIQSINVLKGQKTKETDDKEIIDALILITSKTSIKSPKKRKNG